MEMRATPLCSMLSSVAIEHGEEALTADTTEIDYERVGILHGSSGAFVFGYTDLILGILGGMTIEDLRKK